MKKIWIIGLHEFRIRVRSKWFLISTFGLPIIIISLSLVSGYVAGSGIGSSVKHYGVLDETGIYGKSVAADLEQQYKDGEEGLY
ncbi:MAG TPA: hypothetical protein DHU63_11465, partial [Candidatus Marinimicrobia bacterium]|nr:hypothetical protein [Candidatus Neomarinimicrobiota bacterium]